jgi:rod shape determining protein RodA
MARLERERLAHFDFWLLGATILLGLIGIAMIYSATACIDPAPLDLSSPSVRQAIYMVAGVVGMILLSFIDFRYYAGLRWFIWGGTLAILGAVAILGQITHGAQRWIDLKIFLFQPSELSKLLLILVVAKFMSDHANKMDRLSSLALSFVFVAIPMLLVYFQPDLGTTIVLGATWVVMALASGIRVRYVLIAGGIFLIAAPFIWANLRPYQQERILTFIDPGRDPLGTGYNVTQSRIAIGSGGVWGSGFCSGTQSQLRFLRNRSTDFIFSVIAEELGFIGSIGIIALFGFILFRLVRAASLARNDFGKLIAMGVTGMIFTQSAVNMGMNLGLMPVTGIPLPFMSAGGSSLISLLAAEGVVQSILLRQHGLELEGASKSYE